MLPGMTNSTPALSSVLHRYEVNPLDDGDVVLFLDDKLSVEVDQLAEEWDAELCASVARTVRETARRLQVLVSRENGDLRASDYQLWRDLHAALRDSAVELAPVRPLPARRPQVRRAG